MTYRTYITEAIVCGSRNMQTADRSFLLFTRELGMVRAHAKSVREERSKHRYALQPCTHVRATLIQGKSGWKVTGSETLKNFYTHMETRTHRAVLRNLLVLITRVIQGESAHPEIFDDLIVGLAHTPVATEKPIEEIIALRVLHALGYVAPHAHFAPVIHAPFQEVLSATQASSFATDARTAIAHALTQSQL